ncbi:hypothetical protein ACFLUG_03580 [Chloroflexota bacterium]
MNTKSGSILFNIFRYTGYAFLAIGLLSLMFIITVSIPSLNIDDGVTLIVLLFYIGSLFLAHQRPIITGIILITITLAVGVPPIITSYIWVGALYGLPPLIAGIAFIISGIWTSMEEKQLRQRRALSA